MRGMAGMILCYVLFGAGGWDFGDLGFGTGVFGEGWDPMMMMDWFRFYSSRGFVECCVGWMRERGDMKRSRVSK